MLAVTARTFAQRPSALLAIEDEVLALAVDLAAAIRLRKESGVRSQESEADAEQLERGLTF